MLRKSYWFVYEHSPKPVRSALTRAVFSLSKKPFVKPCAVPESQRFPAPYRGCMIISADFEMAWAWRYAKSRKEPVAMGLKERSNVPKLVRLFEQYEIPITWATVGHLFLSQCEREEGKAHPELSRLKHFSSRWSYTEGDWFDHDPCTSYDLDPAWYAPDLIRMILNSKVSHEIGCHTFSHIDCSDLHCPPEVLDDELRICIKLAQAEGIRLRSMVFPGGKNGNYPVLKARGFTSYRYNDRRWDLFYPEKDHDGLWRLPSSTSIGADGFKWSLSYRMKQFRKYIDAAIRKRSVFHLWFHPSLDDFSLNSVFPSVLDYASQKRKKGDLWIATMSDLSDFCEEQSLMILHSNDCCRRNN